MDRIQELLQEVRVFDGPSNLAENRLIGLYDLLRFIDLPKDQIVMGEVGSYSGTTTELFSYFAKNVYAIDTWETSLEIQDGFRIQKAERLFDEMLDRSPNVVKVKCETILKGSELVEEEAFDFLYMDGTHDYESVKTRLQAYISKVKPGGYIALHDCHLEQVRRAFEEVVGTDLHLFHDQSALYRKPGNLNTVQCNSILLSLRAAPTPTPTPTPEPIVEEVVDVVEIKKDGKLESGRKNPTFLNKID